MNFDPKFLNLNSDQTNNLHLFINNYKNQLQKKSPRSQETQSLFYSSNFSKSLRNLKTSEQNEIKINSKFHTNRYFKKIFPSFSRKNSENDSAIQSSNEKKSYFSQKAIKSESKFLKYNPIFPENFPNNSNIRDLLLKDYDDSMKILLKTLDFKQFIHNQSSRFQKVKDLSNYLIKEIERNFNEMNMNTGQNSFFLTDLLKLLNADYNKIINYFIEFMKTFLILKHDTDANEKVEIIKTSLEATANEKNEKNNNNKKDLMSKFLNIFALLERIYPIPNNSKKANLFVEMIKDLNEQKEKMKNSIRISENDFRAYRFIENLENYMKEMHEIHDNQECEIEKLKAEINKYMIFHEDNYCILSKTKTDELLSKALHSDTISQRYDLIKKKMSGLDQFTDKIQILENKISMQNNELEQKKLIISELEEKNKELKTIINSKPTKYHKECQATNYNNDQISITREVRSNQIIKNIMEKSTVGFKINYDCCSSLMSLIVNDKLIHDYYQIKENKKPKILHSFIYQWFSTHLGNARVAQQFINDFFASLILEKQQRFRLFLELSGVNSNEVFHKGLQSTKNVTNYKQAIKLMTNERLDLNKIFMRSAYSCKILLKALYLIKFSQLNTLDKYSPLFPIINNDLNTCGFDLFISVFRQILNEEGYPIEIVEESCSNFLDHFMNSNDIVLKKGTMSPTLYDRYKSNVLEKTKITIDSFLVYLMEFFSENFRVKIDKIIKGFEIISINKQFLDNVNITCDEFKMILSKAFPKKTNIWYENLFTKFCLKNFEVNSISIHQKFVNICEEFLKVENDYISFGFEKTVEKNPSFEIEQRNRSVSKKKNANEIDNKLDKIRLIPKNDGEYETFKNENFDVVNNVFVINELYNLIIGLILKEEPKNETLFINHQIFKKEFMKLPNINLLKNTKFYTKILSDDRKETLERIDKIWSIFRIILDFLVFDNLAQ